MAALAAGIQKRKRGGAYGKDQQKGCSDLGNGNFEMTLYTCCCNGDKGIYYYTTYGNHQITAVDMHREDLEGDQLIPYPLVQKEQILYQN